MTVRELRQKVEYRKGQRDQLRRTADELEQKSVHTRRHGIRLELALEIAKQVGLLTQKQLEFHLSEQVSMAMDAVFDDPYRMKVNFLERRDRTEVEFLFCRRDMEFPAIGNAGGGAIDVACLALRVAYLSMRQDKKVRPLLLLDEPFSQLKGEDANLRALAVLREISKSLGIQIIMISDERVAREDIVGNADNVFCVAQDRKGVSIVSQEE